MNTIKMVQFTSGPSSFFFQFLQTLADKKAWGWTFETLADFQWSALQGASAAMISTELSEKALEKVQRVPSLVRALQCFDALFLEQGQWYPRLVKHEVLRHLLVARAKDLDIRSPAFIVGQGADLRIAASVLAELGFREIILVGDLEDMATQKTILGRSLLGVHFEILDSEHLTLQALSASIIVNTWDLSLHKALLTDLSYFNYMKEDGYVLDLFSLSPHNVLLQEAESARLRVISPTEYAAADTFFLLSRLKTGADVSLKELTSMWDVYIRENCS